MKNAMIILVGLLLAACSGKQIAGGGTATLSGRITNPAIGSVTLSGDNFLQKIPLTDGAFTIAVDLGEAAYFKLWHDRYQALIFLTPGMDLELAVDAGQFETSLSFSGSGAAENDLLARERASLDEKLRRLNRGGTLYNRDEGSFLETMASLYDPLRDDLAANASQYLPEFVNLESLRLTYEQANHLLGYPALYAKTTGDTAFTPSPAYEQFFRQLDWNDAAALKTDAFREFLPKVITVRAGGEGLDPDEALQRGFEYAAQQFTEPSVHDFALFAITRDAIRRDGAHILPATIDTFGKLCRSDRLVAEVEEEYAKWRRLAPGQPFGEYTLLDLQGTPQTLSSLHGKYLLVEVWASWCGVCRSEYPYLESIQKKYAGQENIAFVGISIDENEGAWRRLVQNRQMEGLHLLTPGGWGSTLCQDFQISSLPRFVLLDPRGRIIDYDAPRPSSGSLEARLMELTAAR